MDYIIQISLILTPLLVGYLVSYMKEKGKNKALLEDNQKLTDELEKVKQEYALDLQKRKFQYETKNKLYYEFMDKLDKYNALQMNLLFDELGDVMMKFYESKNDVKREKWTIEFNHTCRNIDTKIKKQASELFSQLNQLKLTSGKNIISLLDELHNEIITLNKNFIDMTNSLPQLLNNENSSKNLKISDKQTGSQILEIKNKLIESLKDELNNI